MDPRFCNDFINDGDVLYQQVKLLITEAIKICPESAKKLLVQELLDEDSLTSFKDDEFASFLWTTMSSMRRADLLAS